MRLSHLTTALLLYLAMIATGLGFLLANIDTRLARIDKATQTVTQRDYLDCQVMATDFMRCQSVPVATQVTP